MCRLKVHCKYIQCPQEKLGDPHVYKVPVHQLKLIAVLCVFQCSCTSCVLHWRHLIWRSQVNFLDTFVHCSKKSCTVIIRFSAQSFDRLFFPRDVRSERDSKSPDAKEKLLWLHQATFSPSLQLVKNFC